MENTDFSIEIYSNTNNFLVQIPFIAQSAKWGCTIEDAWFNVAWDMTSDSSNISIFGYKTSRFTITCDQPVAQYDQNGRTLNNLGHLFAMATSQVPATTLDNLVINTQYGIRDKIEMMAFNGLAALVLKLLDDYGNEVIIQPNSDNTGTIRWSDGTNSICSPIYIKLKFYALK